jgi:hypothetical protein
MEVKAFSFTHRAKVFADDTVGKNSYSVRMARICLS